VIWPPAAQSTKRRGKGLELRFPDPLMISLVIWAELHSDHLGRRELSHRALLAERAPNEMRTRYEADICYRGAMERSWSE
jgi:hypothetical protein